MEITLSKKQGKVIGTITRDWNGDKYTVCVTDFLNTVFEEGIVEPYYEYLVCPMCGSHYRDDRHVRTDVECGWCDGTGLGASRMHDTIDITMAHLVEIKDFDSMWKLHNIIPDTGAKASLSMRIRHVEKVNGIEK